MLNRSFVSSSTDKLFYMLNKELLRSPDNRTTVRGYVTHELVSAKVILTNSYNRIVTLKDRNIDMAYLIGELTLYLEGSNKLDDYTYYSKFWNKVSDDGETINSAYGKRLFKGYDIELSDSIDWYDSQFMYVISRLKSDKYSRKAIMVIYDKADAFDSRDNPCTSSLQFLIRDNKLHCIVNMRSNDLYLGFTYDVPFFTFVQEMVLISLQETYPDLIMGVYTHNVGSLHIYARNFKVAMSLTDDTKSVEHLDIEEQMPRLVKQDIDKWFKDLIYYEILFRTLPSQKYIPIVDATPFQEYAINILKEKRDGIISGTNITE